MGKPPGGIPETAVSMANGGQERARGRANGPAVRGQQGISWPAQPAHRESEQYSDQGF